MVSVPTTLALVVVRASEGVVERTLGVVVVCTRARVVALVALVAVSPPLARVVLLETGGRRTPWSVR